MIKLAMVVKGSMANKGIIISKLFFLILIFSCSAINAEISEYSWKSPDRAEKAAKLIPGRRIPFPKPSEFLADWTQRNVEKWERHHGPLSPADTYKQYVAETPSDEYLLDYIPDHISPYGRVIAGTPVPKPTRSVISPKEARVMINYCPFCGKEHPNVEYRDSRMFELDPNNPFHIWTTCCHQDLYEREEDFPDDYELRPDHTVKFTHLDNTVKEVPATTYTDKNGVTWELYIGTTIAHKRWVRTADMAVDWLEKFSQTGNPFYVHKLAVLLDRVADVYYGLPPAYRNLVIEGKDGGPMLREEWEALPRPVRSVADNGLSLKPGSPGYMFNWNRRLPLVNCGWLFLHKEYIWVEPFARVRHHPVFKYYSEKKYGDPNALDRKVKNKLMREIALMFESIVLESSYQDSQYTDLMVLGILLENRYLFDFAAAHQECVLYNHHYYDGMTAEGAPNYMMMLVPFYNHIKDPQGWLEFAPSFIKDNPFFNVASTQFQKLRTVRNVYLEFGDQIVYAFNPPEEFANSNITSSNEKRPSMNWPGYGFGVLRVGGPGHRQEVSMIYDRQSVHGAADKLGIECWVDGVPVMREGGYAAKSRHVVIDETRPEFKALLDMPYPRPMIPLEGPGGENWLLPYVHSLLSHNTASVDDLETAPGWEAEGIGELITFKGGEASDEPGSAFQILDCRDISSFDRYAKARGLKPPQVSEYRRALLGVEGPEGRPYVVDIFQIASGNTHTLYQSAWAERTGQNLPPAGSKWANMEEYIKHSKESICLSAVNSFKENLQKLRNIQSLKGMPEMWGLTWRTDFAAYRPFTSNGAATPRPWEDDIGIVKLHLIGLNMNHGGKLTLLNGKGPWVAWINQPLPNGETAVGDVGFLDAWDYLIERRTIENSDKAKNKTFKSTFVHILEGFGDKENSVIKNVTRLGSTGRTKVNENAVGIELEMVDGHTDIVVFQSDKGEIEFKNGLTTDARYAMVRQDPSGKMVEAHIVRGTRLKYNDFDINSIGDLNGTIEDIIGDLTGTRLESALIVRPDSPWPLEKKLTGREMLVKLINNRFEAYTIKKVTKRKDHLLRVDLMGHPPFSSGWYQVRVLNPDNKHGRLLSSRRITKGIYSPWWQGWKAWFPERNRTYTIREVGGSSASDLRARVDFTENVDFKADGIKPGDWFMVYAIEPGLQVTVPDDHVWCAEGVNKYNINTDDVPINVTNPEDFESYIPSAWPTGSADWTQEMGWLPLYNDHGWCISGNGSWSVIPDGGICTESPKVLRIDAASSNHSAFWKIGEDISLQAIQTLEAKHRGLQRNNDNYGRVLIGSDAGSVEYQTYYTTGHLNYAYGTEPLPTDKYKWKFGTGISRDWYITQIQFDYSANKVRARFGKALDGQNFWNQWTPWMDMASLNQPEFVRFTFDGVVEIDDVSLMTNLKQVN